MTLATKIGSVAGSLALSFKAAFTAADEKAARIFNRTYGYGGTSSSGKTVTVDTALSLSAFWSCVRLLSETIATLPLDIMRRNDDDSRSTAHDHPLYDLLRHSPNADQTSLELIEGIIFHLCTFGNAYVLKTYSGNKVIALTILRPALMRVRRLADGSPEYRYTDRGKTEVFPENLIWHIRGFGDGDLLGLSPVSFARQTLGLAMAAEEVAGATFRNGVHPSGIFKTVKVLDKEQRKDFRENIINPFVGTMASGGVMIVEAGMEFQNISMNAEDFQLLQSRGFNVEEVCRWMRVPPVLIGHSAAGQTMWGSGVEQIIIGWLTTGLQIYLSRVEQSAHRSLLRPEERSSYFFRFNNEALLRGDSAARAKFYGQMTTNGIYTRNECRVKENLPRVDGGDELTVQSALIPLRMLGTVARIPTETALPKPDNDEERDDDEPKRIGNE